jgi:excisionase family DNA binding protein
MSEEMATVMERLEQIERMTLLAAKNVLVLDDVAMLTGYSKKYLRLLIANRDIPHYRRGNRLYFAREEIDGWMLEQRIPTNGETEALAVGYINSKLNRQCGKP